MARMATYRRSCPELVITRQIQASQSTIYIVREIGPTGFLLREQTENKVYKVLIGGIHSCTCSTFLKCNKIELCKHICWILLKKFKLSSSDPLSWQTGLCEREISELLKCSKTSRADIQQNDSESTTVIEKVVRQRELNMGDVCPICQEDFNDDTKGITYCRFGCGNSVHTKCMRIWAAHRKPDGIVECPFCRTDFGPITLLGEERMRSLISRKDFTPGQLEHGGTFCCACGLSPIVGKCYKCDRCDSEDFCLCYNCFKTEIHVDHPFVYRLKTNQKWARVTNRPLLLKIRMNRLDGLLTREITNEDYEILLQLDESLQHESPSSINTISDNHLNTLPSKRLKDSDRLTVDKTGCKICSAAFREGQEVKRMPCCGKWLHRECMEVWLLHWSQSCPFDGLELDDTTFTEFHKKRERSRLAKVTNTKEIQTRCKKHSGGGDWMDFSIHGSNAFSILPAKMLPNKRQDGQATSQAYSMHSFFRHSSVKNCKDDFVKLGFKGYPRRLSPLLTKDLPCIDARHVTITDSKPSNNLIASKSSNLHSKLIGHDHISKSDPITKREHSWPLAANSGKIRLKLIQDNTHPHEHLFTLQDIKSLDMRINNSPSRDSPTKRAEPIHVDQSENLFPPLNFINQ